VSPKKEWHIHRTLVSSPFYVGAITLVTALIDHGTLRWRANLFSAVVVSLTFIASSMLIDRWFRWYCPWRALHRTPTARAAQFLLVMPGNLLDGRLAGPWKGVWWALSFLALDWLSEDDPPDHKARERASAALRRLLERLRAQEPILPPLATVEAYRGSGGRGRL
jgi:hypothetical protein